MRLAPPRGCGIGYGSSALHVTRLRHMTPLSILIASLVIPAVVASVWLAAAVAMSPMFHRGAVPGWVAAGRSLECRGWVRVGWHEIFSSELCFDQELISARYRGIVQLVPMSTLSVVNLMRDQVDGLAIDAGAFPSHSWTRIRPVVRGRPSWLMSIWVPGTPAEWIDRLHNLEWFEQVC